MNNIKTLFPFLFLVFVFLINFVFIVFMHNSWNDSMQKYLPLQYEINNLKSNLSKSHLWLEEAITGDKTIDIQKDVMIPFEHKSYHEYVGIAEKVLTINEDKKYLKQLQNLEKRLESILVLANKRWTNSHKQGIGSKEDQLFDTEYNQIMGILDNLGLKIQEKINQEIENQYEYFKLIIIFFVLINLSLLVAFVLYTRKQKAYETSLFQSNEKSLVTLSSIGDAVVVTDLHGNITFINSAAEKLTEYLNIDVNGLHIDKVLDLYNIQTGEKIQTPINDVLYNNLTKLISNGTLLKSKSGKEYIISDSASPLKAKDGKIFGTVLIFQDDTSKHRVSEELNYQYTILNTVLNTTPDLIFYKDYLNHDGKYIGCNKAFEAFVGKSNIEIVNHTDTELFGEEIGDFFRTKDKAILTENKTIVNEEWVNYPDGSKVLLSTAKTPYLNKHGIVIGVMGTSRDITQKYELNKELQSSHDMFSKLTKNVPGAIYQYRLYPDGHASFPYASDGITDIYEVEPKDIIEDAQPVFDILHPDDLEMIASSIQDSADNMHNWNINYRVDLPKKGVRWLEGFAKPETLEDGSILWYGFIHDITDRKNSENALQEQHKYLQSIIDGVDDPIMVIKEDYTVELMNSALRDSLKDLQVADIFNPKCYEISHHRSTPCDGSDHPCPLRDVLDSKKHISVVHNHGSEDEKKIYIELSASPLFDPENNCIGIIESARDITAHLEVKDELKEQKSILEHEVHHDALTGLPNRILFQDRLIQAIGKAKRNNSKLALLFIDLDHFKEINDSFGHYAGDEILKTVTARLKETIRGNDTLARLGGDEFTVILEDLHQTQDASWISSKILESLSEPISFHDSLLYVSSSIGISIYPDDGESAQSLLKFADSAMYKAKDEGRNNFQYYNSTLTELAFERVVMETALRAALINKEFVVYYQAQVDGATDTIVGMEALVRWNHPTMGLVSPAKFIPLAESTGLIIKLDRYVMKTAMTQMKEWHKKGLNPGILAMNLAVKQLQQEDFIEMFKQLMTETECKAEWLALEVTEGQIMTHPEKAIVILQKISDLGIELAVDDFGTGYSSLAYLKRLPIDKLKIDQAFVKDLPGDEEDAGITKAVIALAKSLNLKVIAEGVETKEQRDFIVENGCSNIQGYFYSKPITSGEFEELLRKGF